MSAGSRALLLVVPLVAFAVFGLLHGSHLSRQVPGIDQLAGASGQLPALPPWAHAPLPDFSGYSDTTEKKAAFFSFLYPRIVLANSRVLLTRRHMLSLDQQADLDPQELAWLSEQSETLGIREEAGSDDMFLALTRKLDVIPPSLIMAQAANESAWGTSRFARDGNNLFGQWCFSVGCGLVPLSRSADAVHEVRRFDSPYDSINAYILNLNRHNSYRELRQIREQAREEHVYADGNTLAQGLSRYSERGEAYVREIQEMIHFNNLSFYDRQFVTLIRNHDGKALRVLAATDDEQLMSSYTTAQKPEASDEG